MRRPINTLVSAKRVFAGSRVVGPLTVALAAVFLFPTGSRAQSDAETESTDRWTIVHAGTLLQVPGEEPLERQTLVIKNDRVERRVDGFATRESLGLDVVQIIDLTDDFVLPGLTDVHVHLTSGSLPSSVRDEAADVYRLTMGIVNARKTLRAGYTTVRNPGAVGWSIFALRDGIDEGDLEGPRMFVAGHTIRIGTEGGSGSCYSVESCREAVRRQIQMGADFIKVYATCSGGQPCSHEKAPAVFLKDELEAVVQTAKTREMKVAAHAHTTAGINLALEAGVDSIEHGSWLNERSYELLLERGGYLVPTLMVRDRTRRTLDNPDALTPERRTRLERSQKEHPRRVAEAVKAGVMIASGSDAGVVPHGENARELEWYVDIGMTEMEAIVAATVNAAALLGEEQDLGTLESGKFADVIAVSGNPLEDISVLKAIEFVMKAGTVFVP
jgi:imidazolonepropionase-like amidohydrolase